MTAAAPLMALRLEMLRLTRSGTLVGLAVAFAFFGVSGPAIALFMPQILGAATASGQLTIEAAEATPEAAITLFTQSAMQLGLIFAVAVAVTALSWDTRPGSAVFYRTRLQHLGALTLPRLAVDCLAAVTAYALGLVLAVSLTTLSIGPVSAAFGLRIGVASALYLVMCMSIGHLVMTLTRRTAAAIALSTALVLVLPLLSQLPWIGAVAPTTLLAASELSTAALRGPAALAVIVTAGCVGAATLLARGQALRRDA